MPPLEPRSAASFSSCSTASAPANCPTPPRTATRAATRSATSPARFRCSVPTLRSLGLAARRRSVAGTTPRPSPLGAFGRMAEASPGKDSVTGHWELAGLVLDRAVSRVSRRLSAGRHARVRGAHRPATLGNKAASGTAIIDELGPEHMRTGSPIVYTSADSVFQIAAHEDIDPAPRAVPSSARSRSSSSASGLGVGRVIARPFVGAPGSFTAHGQPPRLRADAVRADAARSR